MLKAILNRLKLQAEEIITEEQPGLRCGRSNDNNNIIQRRKSRFFYNRLTVQYVRNSGRMATVLHVWLLLPPWSD